MAVAAAIAAAVPVKAQQPEDLQRQLDDLKQQYEKSTNEFQQRIASLEQQIEKQREATEKAKEAAEKAKEGKVSAIELAAQEAAKARREEAAAARAAHAAKPRQWTDASGSHHISATFRGMANELVKLQREDGAIVSIPLEKLCDDDQDYIRNRSRPQ